MAELACSRGWDRPDRDEPHRHDPRSRNRVRSVQPHNGSPRACALCWASFFPIRYSAAILPEPTPAFVSATRALLSKSRAALTVSTVSRPAAISRATNACVAEIPRPAMARTAEALSPAAAGPGLEFRAAPWAYTAIASHDARRNRAWTAALLCLSASTQSSAQQSSMSIRVPARSTASTTGLSASSVASISRSLRPACSIARRRSDSMAGQALMRCTHCVEEKWKKCRRAAGTGVEVGDGHNTTIAVRVVRVVGCLRDRPLDDPIGEEKNGNYYGGYDGRDLCSADRRPADSVCIVCT